MDQAKPLPKDLQLIYSEVDRLRSMAQHFGVKEEWNRDEVLAACGRIKDAITQQVAINADVCESCGGTYERCTCHDCREGKSYSRCCHAARLMVKREPVTISRTFPISETLNFQLERIARGKKMTVNQLIEHCLGSVVVLLAGSNEDQL